MPGPTKESHVPHRHARVTMTAAADTTAESGMMLGLHTNNNPSNSTARQPPYPQNQNTRPPVHHLSQPSAQLSLQPVQHAQRRKHRR